MEEKISTVKSFAESEIDAGAEKIPESSRNKFQTAAHAYLNFRADNLTELRKEGSYDASLAERIFSFGDGIDGDTDTAYPDWMKSPEIQALASPSKLVGRSQTINSRTGLPYVRGPYTMKSDTIHGLKAGARNSNPKEKTTAQAANVTVEELAAERADAMSVEMQKDRLEKQLADAKAALAKLKSEQEQAEREYQSKILQAARDTAEQLRAEFQRGLEMGARLVSGGVTAAFPAPH